MKKYFDAVKTNTLSQILLLKTEGGQNFRDNTV